MISVSWPKQQNADRDWCKLQQIVAVTAEWLVDSIDGLTDSGHISKEFVGLILLPIVGNAAGMPPSTVPECRLSRLMAFSLPPSPSTRARNGRHGIRQGQAHTIARCRGRLEYRASSPPNTPQAINLTAFWNTCTANRSLCYPVHRDPRMDPGQAAQLAL